MTASSPITLDRTTRIVGRCLFSFGVFIRVFLSSPPRESLPDFLQHHAQVARWRDDAFAGPV